MSLVLASYAAPALCPAEAGGARPALGRASTALSLPSSARFIQPAGSHLVNSKSSIVLFQLPGTGFAEFFAST